MTKWIKTFLYLTVLVTPIDAFELLFFALFGLTGATDFKIETFGQPDWTLILFKIFFGGYMLVTVVVLINLLIAMMSDTYQRIQAQSDIEWKYGLAKLIRNMHRTSATPSPINLFTSWVIWIITKCQKRKGTNLISSLTYWFIAYTKHLCIFCRTFESFEMGT